MYALLQSELLWELDSWQRLVAGLGEGHTVCFFDPRGVGLSSEPGDDFSIDTQVDDLMTVVKAITDRPVALLGTYYSGKLAIEFATRYPALVSELILLNAYADETRYQERTPATAVRNIADTAPRDFAAMALAPVLGAGVSDLARDVSERMLAENVERLIANHGTSNHVREGLNFSVAASLGRVSAPTLVLHRSGLHYPDEVFSRELAAGIPGAEFRRLSGDSMFAHLGNVDELVGTVNTFLARSHPGEHGPTGATQSPFQTIMFTDLESSTALTQRLGDAGAQEGPPRPQRRRPQVAGNPRRTGSEAHRRRHHGGLSVGRAGGGSGPADPARPRRR